MSICLSICQNIFNGFFCVMIIVIKKNRCLQYDTTSNSNILPKLCLKQYKTADTHFKTVIPFLFMIAKNTGVEIPLEIFKNQYCVKY